MTGARRLLGAWRRGTADTLELLVTCYRQDRGRTLVALALMVAGTVAAPLTALALRAMTDAAVDGAAGRVVVAAVVVAAAGIATLTFAHFAHIAYFELAELDVLAYEARFMTISNGSASMAHHDSPRFADTLTVLEREIQRLRVGLQALLTAMGLAGALILTFVALGTVDPWLFLLPLAALPALVLGGAAERVVDRARGESAPSTRGARHLYRLATTASASKELRVLRLRDEMRTRHSALWSDATATLHRAQVRGALLRLLGQLAFVAAYVAAVLIVVRAALAGERSAGDVVLVVVAAAQVNLQVTAAVTVGQDLARLRSTFRRMREAEEQAAPPTPDGTGTPPARLTRGIEVDRVTFGYDSSPDLALRDVSLSLPAGATVAIVGENGSGKSSLVKILCGLYEPTSGTVRVDAVDLRDLAPHAWSARLAACFQDFVRFELPAVQAVGVGDVRHVDDEVRVGAALARADAQDVVDQLEDGLRTPLGKTYADGAELSGGQWQRLALGRTFMREDPLLVVLDEPTSALDAETEYALFTRYAEHARRTHHATGAVTVLVSHRFTTVRMADLIVVMADGRVHEVGSHDELVASGGLYSQLHHIQAAAYRS
ncbi:ABC transporter related protein [Cellulomonas flavigena DSM 20109]|uniref:ABC transporter related protein n=1 Tax=Cellulomonas flavigena (strain ATCC 482 / DSM 20109 / BCRC 11376 / JCM 18109 / NBRC 3775 / NCIMB 8073 / NRS 134) TaxID=446466 RepID=D5UDK5_CELFN|nr:ABC transporter ATP-binding protein [Cellulomonas flavigena]ADG76461.1 ABC transporter related protein [Cellulomonas flavigena DSM 20109]